MYSFNKSKQCNNCGKNGHFQKSCKEPITSVGIIALKFNNETHSKIILDECCQISDSYQKPINIEMIHDDDACVCNNTISNNTISNNNLDDTSVYANLHGLEVLLICRRFTLGYSEFIRGKYEMNIDSIVHLFKQMIQSEIDLIATSDFDKLWINLWNNDKNNEYRTSKSKFDDIKIFHTSGITLESIIEKTELEWLEPEWGFPKGRRNKFESNYQCAIREFCEETNLKKNDFNIIETIEPIIENFVGTNGVQYRHIYYVALLKNNQPIDKILLIDQSNYKEIGNISLFNYKNALLKIRPYHAQRLSIIKNIYCFMHQYLSQTWLKTNLNNNNMNDLNHDFYNNNCIDGYTDNSDNDISNNVIKQVNMSQSC
jgi:8-oxo-dGTP pyrophosphatase MutT (NUDIX family)